MWWVKAFQRMILSLSLETQKIAETRESNRGMQRKAMIFPEIQIDC